MPGLSQLSPCYKKDQIHASILDAPLASFKHLFFIFAFGHSAFMKGYCMFWATEIHCPQLWDSLFKWASSGISLTKVLFHSIFIGCKLSSLSSRPQPNYFSAMYGTEKLQINHPDFSESFQEVVFLFYLDMLFIARHMLWLRKARQHRNAKTFIIRRNWKRMIKGKEVMKAWTGKII